MIPKNIFQIYHDKKLVPELITDRIKILNPTYSYNIFDFDEGKDLILKEFDDIDPNIICQTIDKLPRLCHKSDLMRYCLLYLRGGFYLDVDLEILLPFKELSFMGDFITSFGRGAEGFSCTFRNGQTKTVEKIMANGIIAAKRKSPILLELIRFCVNNPADDNPHNRGLYIKFLYQYLCSKSTDGIRPFEKLKIKNEIVYLFDTIDNKHYGINCIFDLDKGIIINPNNKNHQIPRQTSSFI